MDPLVKDYILKIPLFSGVKHSELLPLIENCRVREYEPGQFIYRYGEYGEECGIILSGSASVKLPPKGPEHPNKEILLRQGDIFGEIAVLSGYTRTADVVALQLTRAFMVSRETLLDLFYKFPPIKKEIDRLYRQRVLIDQLLTVPIFSGVPERLLEELVRKATLHHYIKGEIVFRQGDEAAAFYLVRYGAVKVTETESDGKMRVLAYLKGGHYFGEIAIMKTGKKRMSTVTAINRTELIRISSEDFLDMIESYPRVKAGLEKVMEKTKERNVRIRENKLMEKTLSVAIDSGIIQAIGILVIDTTKCIQCDNCIKACAALHNNQSRLVRKGSKLNNIFLIPTSCKHCDDPTCMIKCSTGSIARDFSGEIYHKDSCIGCGSCARNCPYGNISIVSLTETGREPESKSTVEKKDKEGNLLKMAVKCDMCREYPFVGCIYNCPKGAVRKVDPAEFFADFTAVG